MDFLQSILFMPVLTWHRSFDTIPIHSSSQIKPAIKLKEETGAYIPSILLLSVVRLCSKSDAL